MSHTVFRCVSPSSTISASSSPPTSEADSSAIITPPSSPSNHSNLGRIDTMSPLNTSISFPLNSLPNLSLDAAQIALNVRKWLRRIRSFCQACYFFDEQRPIQVIEVFPNGRRSEWEDYHPEDGERCPWRVLHPSTAYDDFRRQICSAMRLYHPCQSEPTMCVICAELYACRADHEYNGHGPSLFMVAFLVWEDVAICDHVFSFFRTHTLIRVPELRSRAEYAYWLGSSVCEPWSSLLYLHILVEVYHALRRSGLLPLYVFLFNSVDYSFQPHRAGRPDVEDIVIYRTLHSP